MSNPFPVIERAVITPMAQPRWDWSLPGVRYADTKILRLQLTNGATSLHEAKALAATTAYQEDADCIAASLSWMA